MEADTREKLAKFLDAGIRTFINLTEERELSSYEHILQELSAERGIETTHIRQSIRDYSTPRERAQMVSILATIRDEIAAGRPVYVHCWGGIGRTGTVIGCWLVEQGLTGEDALRRIAELRRGTPDGRLRSPESVDQCRYVREGWRGSDRFHGDLLGLAIGDALDERIDSHKASAAWWRREAARRPSCTSLATIGWRPR